MSSVHSGIFTKLDFPLKFNCYLPHPSYHPTNQNVVIVSTDYEEGNQKGIYEYNLIRHTFNKIYTYKQSFKPYDHGQFVDAKNELLYMVGRGKLGIFDLNTKVMNANNTFCVCGTFPQSTYIPSPI
eukprot:186564_1